MSTDQPRTLDQADEALRNQINDTSFRIYKRLKPHMETVNGNEAPDNFIDDAKTYITAVETLKTLRSLREGK